MEPTRVLLAIDTTELADVVIDYLDRSGRVRVVATAVDERQVVEAARQVDPQAIVASPNVLSSLGPLDLPLIVIDTDAQAGVLRSALECGAEAFVVWPDERVDLLDAISRAVGPTARAAASDALVTGVVGARGGAGATFIATHLADAFVRAEAGRVLLVDGDYLGTGAGVALGASRVEGLRTVADLVPVLGELTPEHLSEVLWEHPRGFRVALAPRSARVATDLSPEVLGAVMSAGMSAFDHVIVDLPRSAEFLNVAGRSLDHLLIALPLDVASFAAAARLLELSDQAKLRYVVNLATRADVTPDDVSRVFRSEPIAVIPVDRRVRMSQDRGQLLSSRTRIARELDRIALTLLPSAETEVAA